MGFVLLITGAVIALIGALFVNSIVGLLSGDRPGSLGGTWWDIFSNMWRRESSYAKPLPEVLQPRRFGVGDRIRIFRAPSNADHTVSPERQELLQRCVGKVLRVQRIDAYGALELHVRDDGSQAPDRYHHIVLIEPQYVERAGSNIS
jgi:hypothetical protein